jgi:DNA-binding response OmpR family regulator
MRAIESAGEAAAKIMVVDDSPSNLLLLEGILGQKGYSVRSFPCGGMALAAAALQPPDLILLDVNMPELNGYEVCAQLKADTALSAIPVIFLSALHGTDDKVKAFRSGGVDYISKPFQIEEVYSRVETHIRLHDLQRVLKSQNRDLEETVASRTRELSAAHAQLTKLDQAKNDFLKIISHEFRTPLNGIFGIGEILFDELTALPEHEELSRLFERSRHRIMSLLDDALLLTQIDLDAIRFRSSPVSLSAELNRAIERVSEFARSREVKVHSPSADLGLIQGDSDLVAGAFHALLETAVKFSEQGETVSVAHQVVAESVQLTFETNGKTIPSSVIAKFFDVFSISEVITPGGDLGLRSPMAWRILSLFGGTVTVANRNPPGIRLTVAF